MVFRRKKNSPFIEEYFVNDTYLKKLYNYYIRKSSFERAVDYAVFFAIIFTSVSLVLNFLIDLDKRILYLINISSGLILFIFIFELIINYFNSKSFNHFFKKHWLDFILVSFLSFYFLFVSLFSIFKFDLFVRLKGFFTDLKHYKIMVRSLKLFKKFLKL